MKGPRSKGVIRRLKDVMGMRVFGREGQEGRAKEIQEVRGERVREGGKAHERGEGARE